MKLVVADRVFLSDLKTYQDPEQKLTVLEYNEAIKTAKIAFIGEDVKDMVPGDQVVLQTPCGVEVEHEGVKYQVVRRTDIMFVL